MKARKIEVEGSADDNIEYRIGPGGKLSKVDISDFRSFMNNYFAKHLEEIFAQYGRDVVMAEVFPKSVHRYRLEGDKIVRIGKPNPSKPAAQHVKELAARMPRQLKPTESVVFFGNSLSVECGRCGAYGTTDTGHKYCAHVECPIARKLKRHRKRKRTSSLENVYIPRYKAMKNMDDEIKAIENGLPVSDESDIR